MVKIKYCEADIFLDKYLPSELTYKIQPMTGGGSRIFLYWQPSIQCNADKSPRFFSEFGRTYLGDRNTNQPHSVYIEKTLRKIHRAILILRLIPSFEVEDILKNIPWEEKEKGSLAEMSL